MILRRRFLFAFAALPIVSALAFAQIPNAGFEDWASGNPTNWATGNAPPVLVTVTQSTTAHGGASSVKGTVISFYTANVAPALQSGPGGRGFRYTSRPTSIGGWYQFHSVGGDRFGVNTALFKGGSAGTVVANAASANATEVPSWTAFTVPFTYATGDVPDTCIIQFQIVGPTGTDYHAGSYFLIDDLTFNGVSGVDDSPTTHAATEFVAAAPNPFATSTTLTFTLAERGPVTLAIHDVQGRTVATLFEGTLDSGRHTLVWDARHAPSGLYWARLKAAGVQRELRLARMR